MIQLSQYEDHELAEEQIREIVALQTSVWPQKGKSIEEQVGEFAQRLRHSSGQNKLRQKRFVIWDSGIALANSTTFARTIATADGWLEVMALAGVCTSPKRRGEGFGKTITRMALGRVDDNEFPVALFQTGIPEYYQKLGGRSISNTFSNGQNADHPTANPWWDSSVMIYPATFDWPDGHIDLNGPGY